MQVNASSFIPSTRTATPAAPHINRDHFGAARISHVDIFLHSRSLGDRFAREAIATQGEKDFQPCVDQQKTGPSPPEP